METRHNRILQNRDLIYPWVKTSIHPPTEKKVVFHEDDSPIYKDWLGDLKIFYAIDEGDSVSFLKQEELPEGYSVQDIHKISSQNLENNIEYRFNKLNFEGGYGLLAGGDYEASSITLDNIWNWIADELEDDIIVGIPTKDLVMMTPLSDTNGIINLASAISDVFKDGDYLLSKSLFRYSKTDGWSLYRP